MSVIAEYACTEKRTVFSVCVRIIGENKIKRTVKVVLYTIEERLTTTNNTKRRQDESLSKKISMVMSLQNVRGI